MINKLKFIFFTLISFAPFFAAIPTAIAAIAVSAQVANATYISIESIEIIELEASPETLMSKIGSMLSNLFSTTSLKLRSAGTANANKTASIVNAIPKPTEVVEPFGISNFKWGMISGPEDANVSFDYRTAPDTEADYNMAVLYFNQMPPAEFAYNAQEAVRSTNKIPHSVVGVDYLNCYSNDAETHKAILLSADSSCALPPGELDNSSILPDTSTITLPIRAIYNSLGSGDVNENDYITIGLYDIDAAGDVIAVRNDTNKYYFER